MYIFVKNIEKNGNVSAWHLRLAEEFCGLSTIYCIAKPLETFFLISSVQMCNILIKNGIKGFPSMIFYTSTDMSRTDKMLTWWVVHLVFEQTIKDISNMNIVLYSIHKKLPKKLFWKVMTKLYTDLNSIFWKITWWKFRVLRKRWKTIFSL